MSGIGRYHSHGTDTELEAALSVGRVVMSRRKMAAILLRSVGVIGLTDDEGGEAMGGDRLTFGRRRQELCMAGLVVDSGKRRFTPVGRRAVVWVWVGE